MLSKPIRRLFLKSIPVDVLIREWLHVRSLRWIPEERFPAELKRQADAESFTDRAGGELLGDRRELRLGLVCANPTERASLTRSERLQHLEDLRDYLCNCGRDPEEFEFFRPSRFEFRMMDGIVPLFFVLWSPDTPLLERVLAGKKDLPGRIKGDRFTFRELRLDDPAEPSSLPVAAGSSSPDGAEGGAADSIVTVAGPVKYQLVGSVRGTPHRKMFVRLTGDRLFLVYFASAVRLSQDYVTAFIDSLASSTRPVYRLEEHLLHYPPSDVSVTVLEMRGDRQMEILSWGLEHAFFRNEKGLRFLSDQKGGNLHILRLQLTPGDRLLLLPTALNKAEKKELAEILTGDLTGLDGWLNTKGIGRTLALVPAV